MFLIFTGVTDYFVLLRLQYTFRGVSPYRAMQRVWFNCRQLKTYIKLKPAYRTGYQTIPTILKRNKLANFLRLLNASALITFLTLHVRANFVFRLFNASFSFRAQSAKKCPRFAKFDFSEKLQNIFEVGLEKIWSVRTKIALIEKLVMFSSGQNSRPLFLCQYLIFFNDFVFTLDISFGSLL